MSGLQFNRATFRLYLRFDGPSIQSWSQSLVTADGNDVSYSAQTNGGVPRIKLAHSYPDPDTVAPVPARGAVATDEAARAYLLALANAYVLIRSFRQTRQGDGLVTIVRAYHANVANTSPITQAQLDAYIRIPPTPNYISIGNLFFSSTYPWNQMQNDFAQRIDLEWTYCHGNFPPPCHGSRGRR